jgi:phosphatidylserine decarboxylase
MRAALTPILRIAPEGWVLLFLALFPALLAALHEHWLLLVILLMAALVLGMFFHESPRQSPARPLGVLAPVDGIVTLRRECHDPYLGREAIRIRIRLAWFSNYCLRAPLEGEVIAVNAPRTVSAICTDEGETVLMVSTRGWLLGSKPIWADYGERVGQGRRCGARRLMREIELLLPANSRVEVAEGQTVRCGETNLATLLRRPA